MEGVSGEANQVVSSDLLEPKLHASPIPIRNSAREDHNSNVMTTVVATEGPSLLDQCVPVAHFGAR